MKRFLTILLLLSISICTFAQQAQVTIVSKKEKLSDFQTKTMKVVLLGEDYISLSLREAMKNSWSISAYEFCDKAEFDRIKKDDKFYFMIIINNNQDKKDEGISYLRIVKGGEEDFNDMLEVITMPICASDEHMGREGAYMPLILGTMQNYIEKSLLGSFKNPSSIIKKAPKGKHINILLDENDLSNQIDEKVRTKRLAGIIRSEKEVAEAIQYGLSNTMVGYSIYPSNPKEGAICYKMLFDTRTHDIYYFKKHKISESKGKGFLKSDIMKITAGR